MIVHFVAALRRRRAEDRAQNHAGILVGRRRSAPQAFTISCGVLQEFRDVDAHDRAGHHAEIRKRGVTSADARHAEENLAEFVALPPPAASSSRDR